MRLSYDVPQHRSSERNHRDDAILDSIGLEEEEDGDDDDDDDKVD
jgi:hypothetical protein